MVFAVPDQKSQGIVDLLVKELVPFFGVPECLLLDWGTNLLSNLMKNVCEALGITKLNTTAYHPQSMLQKHAAQFGKEWEKNVYGVLWAYRNTPHENTYEKPG